MMFAKFNTNLQLKLNNELLARAKDNPNADYIPNLISKIDFMKLVDGELLHLGLALTLSAYMEILKMDIKIMPYIGHRTMIDASKFYFDIFLTGKDILKLMHRELYYGEGNLLGKPLDVSMYEILANDNVLVPDVKEVFKYYAAYERRKYNKPPIAATLLCDSERPSLESGGWKYERVSILEIGKVELSNYDAYSIADTGDVDYNPTTDWFHWFKKLFKMDPDSKLKGKTVLPYFELWAMK